MFSFVRSIMGRAVAEVAADSEFIAAVCEEKHAGPVVRAFAAVNLELPAKRAACIVALRKIVNDPPAIGASDAVRVGFPLFAAACLSALETQNPELLQRYESDLKSGIDALKAKRAESKKRAKGETPAPAAGSTPAPAAGSTPAPAAGSTPAPAAGSTPAPAAGSTPAPMGADAIDSALAVLLDAARAGLMLPEHWASVHALHALAPAATPAPAATEEPATA